MCDKTRPSQLNWTLTEEAFAKFLACLDPDSLRAGEKYEALRDALVKFLDWRGANFPEELVDETFNRVARKLDEGEKITDVPAFCHGVARRVFLQSLAHPSNKRAEFAELLSLEIPAPNTEAEAVDVLPGCLKRCLDQLPAENRLLITDYYRKERRKKIDNRILLAEKLGIPLNALRSRAHRIRDKLERCITRCSKK